MVSEKYTVYLGESLSGELVPSLLEEGEVLLGVKTCGLIGFIEFLEQHLGLRCPRNPVPLQLESYLQALLKAKEGSFFARSLEVDPHSVARDLFEKRIELLEQGFDFDLNALPKRFQDLKNVEDHFVLKESLPDRTIRILLFLQSELKLPLGEVKLLRSRTDFAPLYQRLFNKLEELRVNFTEVEIEINTPEIKLIEVKNEFEASLAISRLMKENKEAVTLINSACDLVDLHCQTDGLPALGAEVTSFARPVIQLVHLTSEFLWEPLDPRRVIEFLNLPVKPLAGKLCSRLSDVLTDTPGFGGTPWKEAIKAYFDDETDEDAKKKNQDRLKVLFERKRFARSGAPLSEIAELFSFLARYLRGRDFLQEAGTVQAICDLMNLMAKRKTSLSKLELERVVEINISGLSFSEKPRQVGSHSVITHTENIAGSIEELIWYPFVDHGGSAGVSFCSKEETDYLAKYKIVIEKPFEKVRKTLELEKRMLTSAKKTVYLIKPSSVGSEMSSEHPLTHQIKFDKVNVQELFSPILEKVKLKKLPSVKAHWKVKLPESLKKRSRESYSSLEKLFYWPWLYVLENHAQLQSHSSLSIADDYRIRGTFTHRIFEEFFMTYKTPLEMKTNPPDIWFDKNIEALTTQYGVLWMQDGLEVALAQLKAEMRRGLKALSDHLIESDWTVDEMEKKIEGKIFDTEFIGYMDMALVRGNERCVLDLKYPATDKYKKLLENNQDLQLGLYSKKYGNKTFAYTAYFVIQNARLYSKEKSAFKKPYNKPLDKHHEAYSELWDQMEQTYHARRDEISKGEIVVRDLLTLEDIEEPNVNGTEHVDLSKIENNRYHDFDVLVGLIKRNT